MKMTESLLQNFRFSDINKEVKEKMEEFNVLKVSVQRVKKCSPFEIFLTCKIEQVIKIFKTKIEADELKAELTRLNRMKDIIFITC